MSAEHPNHGTVALFELVDNAHRACNTSKEGAGPHSSGDGRIPAVVGEEKEAVTKFDARHVLTKVDRPLHTPVSCSSEQLEIEPQAKPLIKSITPVFLSPVSGRSS